MPEGHAAGIGSCGKSESNHLGKKCATLLKYHPKTGLSGVKKEGKKKRQTQGNASLTALTNLRTLQFAL